MTRKAESAQFVIYVQDLNRSREFYERVFDTESVISKDSFAAIPICDNLHLGITTESEIVKILGTSVPHPMIANGIPRNELYVYLDDPEKTYQRAIDLGANPISDYELRPWGHHVAYAMDFDGNILAFAKAN